MISIVIPTLNSQDTLNDTFACLVPATMEGLVREVVVVDGGSSDRTCEIADAAGATIVHSQKGRGRQLRAGGDKAKSDWLLFLHADTKLAPTWAKEVADLIASPQREFAAAFRFALDDQRLAARILERIVALRCHALKLPYGDQGLLIHRTFYRKLGGFPEVDLMEDVALIRKVGWRRTNLLKSCAVTSPKRFQKDGYFLRPLRNFCILTLYLLRVPTRVLVRLYE
jgi:rSAM/selenodomain-associated transferase 2